MHEILLWYWEILEAINSANGRLNIRPLETFIQRNLNNFTRYKTYSRMHQHAHISFFT